MSAKSEGEEGRKLGAQQKHAKTSRRGPTLSKAARSLGKLSIALQRKRDQQQQPEVAKPTTPRRQPSARPTSSTHRNTPLLPTPT
jgi:hypothetical protein